MFQESDIITCNSYKPLCDYVYQIGNKVPEGLVHVNIEEIPTFFKEIEKYPKRKYVIVSSCSDYGLCEQKYFPPWKDIPKWANMMCGPDLGYQGVQIESRVNLEKCNERDKYSIKCYAHTRETFNEIPKNVIKWFMTNAALYDDRIISIPFGAAPNKEKILAGRKSNHTNLLYINYSNTTFDRVEYLRNFVKKTTQGLLVQKWVTYSKEKPYEDYLKDLEKHTFVLSPPGNGLDCYRTWESIYCGSVPIVGMTHLNHAWNNINLLLCENFHQINQRSLEEVKAKFEFSNDVARLGYWKDEFNKARRQLR